MTPTAKFNWNMASFSLCVFLCFRTFKKEEGSFYKITSKLLWLSSQNGSCSFLYQLSDLYLASLQKQSLSSQLVWSSRFWIRSLPLKGLMFPVLSHGFTKSWGKGGVLLGCTGAMLNYKTGYRSGVVIITHKKLVEINLVYIKLAAVMNFNVLSL